MAYKTMYTAAAAAAAAVCCRFESRSPGAANNHCSGSALAGPARTK